MINMDAAEGRWIWSGVYGQQTREQLAAAVARTLGTGEHCHAGGTSSVVRSGPAGLGGRDAVVAAPASPPPSPPSPPKNQKARQTLRSDGPDVRAQLRVPGPGIEPGTRGFSVLAAKWPKPRNAKGFRRSGGGGVTPV